MRVEATAGRKTNPLPKPVFITLAFLVLVAWNGSSLVPQPSSILVSPGTLTGVTSFLGPVTIKNTQNQPYNPDQVEVVGLSGINEAQVGVQSSDSGVVSNTTETTFTVTTFTQGGLYLESRRRRSRLEIYVQIIEQLLSGPSSITEIALRSKTNFSMAKEYIDFLLGRRMIKEVIRDGKVCYAATPEGIQFRDQAETAMRALK